MKFKVNYIIKNIHIICLLATGTDAIAATYFLPETSSKLFESNNSDAEYRNGLADLLKLEILKKTPEQQFKKILGDIEKGNIDEADHKISQLIKEHPSNPDLYSLKAQIYLQRKDHKSAEDNFNMALRIAPTNLRALLGLALLSIMENHLEDANNYAKRAITSNPKSALPYILTANIAGKQHLEEEAEKILTEGLKNVQGNVIEEANIVANLGKLYTIQKKPQKILFLAEELATRYPTTEEALSVLVVAQLSNNQTSNAEVTLQKIINQNKKNVRHRLQLAGLLVNQPEKADQVINLLNELSAIAPNDPQVMLEKSVLLKALKRYNDALVLADHLMKHNPKSGIGQTLQGDIFLAQNKVPQAVTAYRKAYSLNPNDKILNILTDLMITQGQSNEAVQLLNDELSKNAENISTRLKLASVLQQQNKFKEAEIHYKAILAAQPENPLILNNLAWIYSQQNIPEAVEFAERAYQKAADIAIIADTYGVILIKEGKLQQGLEVLERAVKNSPENNDIKFHLAEAYDKNNDHSRAIQILKAILSSQQSFTERKSALELLKRLQAS